jgi:hypothetical protein
MKKILFSWGFRFRFTLEQSQPAPAGFIWFPSDREAITFLMSQAPFLLPGRKNTRYHRHYELVDVAKDWLEPHPGYEIGETTLARGLTQAFDGALAIDWVGSFLQLCGGQGEVERDTRRAFFEAEGLPATDHVSVGGDGNLARRFLTHCSRDGARYWA